MPRNTLPYITGKHFGVLTEDHRVSSVTGDLDVVNGVQPLFQALETLAGVFGTFSIDANGTWTYVLDNSRAATQALSQGEKVVDYFFAQTLDGSLSHLIYVNVHGARDVQLNAAAKARPDDAPISLVGTSAAFVPDNI